MARPHVAVHARRRLRRASTLPVSMHELAAVRHRVARVDGEIEHRGRELVADRPRPATHRPQAPIRSRSARRACAAATPRSRRPAVDVGLCGSSGCLRENASSCWVSSAPRVGRLVDQPRDGGELRLVPTRLGQDLDLPRITVSMLLKSCAMPPVSWPTASIFWACRMRSSATILSVRSRMKPLNTKPSRRRQHGGGKLERNAVPSRRIASI